MNISLSSCAEELLMQALSNRYISVAILDLDTSMAKMLCSKYDIEVVGCELPWKTVIDRFVIQRVCPTDRDRVAEELSLKSLCQLYEGKKREVCIEARCLQESSQIYNWVEVVATPVDKESRKVLVTSKGNSGTLTHKRVLDKFLYHQNCDFFILVDLNNNSYEMFDVGSGMLPIPATGGANYVSDMVQFNRKYVVASDVERVIDLMMPEKIIKLLETQEEYTYSAGIITDSGEYRRAKMQVIAFDLPNSQVIITRSDITALYLEEKQRNDQLVYALRAAHQDLLTSLYNQTTTNKIITQMLENYQEGKAALLFVDIDNFKMVNDTLGHMQGDILLKKVGEFLKNIAQKEWVVGRIGGDEFLVFMPNITTVQEVCQVAGQICSTFDGCKHMLQGLPVTCSVGISLYPQDGLAYEQLIQKADQALYRSKRYGKNIYSLYAEEWKQQEYVTAWSEME